MEHNPFTKTKPPSFLSRDMLAFEQGLPLTLRLTFHSNSTSLIKLVGFTKHAAFSFEVTPVGDLTQESQDFRITDFPIMLSIVTDDDTIVRGDVYAKVELLLRDTVHATLAQGYVSSLNSPSWPHGTQEDSFSGRGKILVITGTNPGLGVEVSETVPANVHWEVFAVRLLLTTDATVQTRTVHLVIQDSASSLIDIISANTQVASLSRNYTFATYTDPIDQQATNDLLTSFPRKVYLPTGFRIVTQTTGFQAGDNWSAPFFHVEQWIVPS